MLLVSVLPKKAPPVSMQGTFARGTPIYCGTTCCAVDDHSATVLGVPSFKILEMCGWRAMFRKYTTIASQVTKLLTLFTDRYTSRSLNVNDEPIDVFDAD